MKELSIFVDESGHFGMHTKHSPYYLVSFVFHNQSNDISQTVATFEKHLSEIGFPKHWVHTEPIIRNESVYKQMTLDERRKIFNSLCRFTRKCPIKHKTFVFRKSQSDNKLQMLVKMSREISAFINEHLPFLDTFDTVKLYYDNGQVEITGIITTVLAPVIENLVYKNAVSEDYRLFQVADLFCTLKLIQEKYKDSGQLSNSENYFFRNYSNFKKNYLPLLEQMELV